MANITMTIDDELLKKVKKIAVEKDTSLTSLVRDYLKQMAKREEQLTEEVIEELSRAMKKDDLVVGSVYWKRADLHER